MISSSDQKTHTKGKTMQFRVIIPPEVVPGQTLRVRCPDGTEGEVKVPQGLKPGNSFIFEMPSEALINNGLPLDSNTTASNQDGTAGGGGGGTDGLRKRSGAGASKSSGVNTSSSGGGTSFLDREIVDKRDFLTALAVGMLIGLSIVGGFLVGVLIATEPQKK